MALASIDQEWKKYYQELGSLAQFPREIRNMIYKYMTAQGSLAIMRTSSTLQEEISEIELGSLVRFPREIRNMIYKHMIAQGSLAIMRTSLILQKEVSEMDFYEHGFCRLNLNFLNPATEELKPCFRPSPFMVKKIRNVAISVNTGLNSATLPDDPPPDIDILDKFIGNKVPRKTCTLSFVCGGETGIMEQLDVLFKVQRYTGFEKVIVAIDCVEQSTNREWPEHVSEFSDEQISEYESKKRAMGTIWSVLVPAMFLAEGGKWQKDGFTPMTFRPREGARAVQCLRIVEMVTGRSILGGWKPCSL